MADDADSLICPITLEVFHDPVRADDGRLYERAAITRWINEHGTSPFTRQVLKLNQLKPDVEIRNKADQRRKSSVEHEQQPEEEEVQLPPIRPSRNVNVNSTPERRSRSVLKTIDRCCNFVCKTSEKCFMFVFRVDL